MRSSISGFSSEGVFSTAGTSTAQSSGNIKTEAWWVCAPLLTAVVYLQQEKPPEKKDEKAQPKNEEEEKKKEEEIKKEEKKEEEPKMEEAKPGKTFFSDSLVCLFRAKVAASRSAGVRLIGFLAWD